MRGTYSHTHVCSWVFHGSGRVIKTIKVLAINHTVLIYLTRYRDHRSTRVPAHGRTLDANLIYVYQDSAQS